MMTITTSTARTFKIAFMHSAPPRDIPRADAGERRALLDEAARDIDRRITLCTISELGSEPKDAVTLSKGIALCHPTDTFEKRVGRKLALTYAMAGAQESISRDERREVWSAYLTQFGQ